jgi:hypothetical protein
MRYGATHGHPLKIREKLCSIIRSFRESGKGLMHRYFFEKNQNHAKKDQASISAVHFAVLCVL